VVSAWALGLGGVAEGLFKMGIGNQIGTRIDDDYDGNLFAQHSPRCCWNAPKISTSA